jgi:hypothetical protein
MIIFPQASGNETNIKLPFSFIFLSILSIIASQILLLVNSEMLSNGVFRVPGIWSAAHLFILGWALTVAMGSMYQLVPVAFLTPIWNETFGFAQFATFAVGIVWFSVALYLAPSSALIPGFITLLGILMFIFQMFMTLRKQAKPNILTAFVGTGLLCLFATILLGITMVLSMKTGYAAQYYQGIFKSHLLLGVVGWFTLLIFGFSYKMVPMFSLAHGYSMGPAKYVFFSYSVGLLITLIALISDQSILLTIGLLLLGIGFALFSWHMSMIIKKRVKKKLDKPFQFALLGIGFGFLLHLLAVIFSLNNSFEMFAAPLLFMYLLTWIAFSIIGYLYKIVPFLWWTHKYSKEIGKKAVPSLKDMMNERIAVPLFGLLLGSALIISFGFLYENQLTFFAGQTLLCISVIIFSGTVASVVKK